MVKTLSPIGNNLGLILDKAVLEYLGISQDTPLDIQTDGGALIIRPLKSPDAAITESTRRMMDIHAETLQKLAQ